MKLLKLVLLSFLVLSYVACDQITTSTEEGDNNPSTEESDNNPSTDENDNNPSTETGKSSGKLSNASYMKAEENRMVDEINLIRQDPTGYVKIVNEYIAQMEKDKAEGIGFSNVDDEIATAHELIAELNNTPKLSFLEPHQGIYNAAVSHGNEGKAKGSLDHQGSDGKWPWDRVKAAAPECSDGNENLVGGSSDVRQSVMMLLVDSGLPGRGHRKTILNPAWTRVACYSVGQVGQMPHYWIQKYGDCQ